MFYSILTCPRVIWIIEEILLENALYILCAQVYLFMN